MLALLRYWVMRGTPHVAKYQRLCGVTVDGPTNAVLHPIFSVGSSMGNELFFLTFFPLVILGFDFEVARRTMVCWSAIYYVGQVLKDVLQLPRPPVAVKLPRDHLCAACPARCGGAWCGGRTGAPAAAAAAPTALVKDAKSGDIFSSLKGVVCLEPHYSAEFGLPSTHAMCSVGLPWSLVAWTKRSGRFEGDPWPLIAFAVFYTFATTFSRPYMGVHSPADIVSGLLLGFAILALHLGVGAAVDSWVVNSPSAPLALPIVLLALVALYPHPAKWKSSPGDTVLVIASTTGVLTAAAVDAALAGGAARAGLVQGAPFSLPSLARLLDVTHLLKFLARVLTIVSACALCRAVVKPVCVQLLVLLLGPAYGDPEEIAAGFRVGDTPMHIIKGTGIPAPSPGGFAAGGGSSSSSSRSSSSRSAHPSPDLPRSSAASSSAPAPPITSSEGGETAPQSARSAAQSAPEETLLDGASGAAAAGRAVEAAAAAAVQPGLEGGGEEKVGELQGGKPALPRLKMERGESLSIKSPTSPRALVPVPPEQRYGIELPTKVVVYGAMGFIIAFVCPKLFVALDI